MHLEKLVKYSVPFFAFAIISRAIDEISFIYYTVPVMCVFYIVLMFSVLRAKSSVQSPQTNSHSDPVSAGEESQPKIIDPSTCLAGRQASLRVTDSKRSGMMWLLFLIPGIWFLLTALWSSYPQISATRALYFILLSAGCISAGILWIRFSGKSILDFLIPANIFIVLLSLFSLITNIPSDSWTGGHGKGFMGFFGHQNLLASVILFTIPAVFAKLRRPVNSEQLKVNSIMNKVKSPLTTDYSLLTFYYLLLTANLLLLTLTYSRASITFISFWCDCIYLILNKKWKVIAYSFGIAVIIAVIIFITPPLKNFTEEIINKDFPEFYSSRIWMWEPSYRAAQEGGLIGLGYGISDPNEKVGGIGRSL